MKNKIKEIIIKLLEPKIGSNFLLKHMFDSNGIPYGRFSLKKNTYFNCNGCCITSLCGVTINEGVYLDNLPSLKVLKGAILKDNVILKGLFSMASVRELYREENSGLAKVQVEKNNSLNEQRMFKTTIKVTTGISSSLEEQEVYKAIHDAYIPI